MSSSLNFSMLQVFLLCVSIVLGTINPPGWLYSIDMDQENLGVHCEGNYPPHVPQILQPWENDLLGDPTYGIYNSLADICLSFEFSGKLINAGGFCPFGAEDPYALSFSPNQYTQEFGLFLYCKTKCWCTGGRSGLTRQTTSAIRTSPARGSYYLYHRQSNAVRPISNILTFTLSQFAELNFGQDTTTVAMRDRKILLTGVSEERVICQDAPIPIPEPPLAHSQYRHLQEFCASSLYGGSQQGNMGGYCHEYDIFGPSWNQDESLAHPKLVGDSPTIAMTKAYCFAKCYCAIGNEQGPLRPLPWDPGCVVDTSDGGVSMYDMTSPPESSEIITILPGSSSSGQSSGNQNQNQNGASTVNLTAACDGHETFSLCKPLASQEREQRRSVRLNMATQHPISRFRRPFVPPRCGSSCSAAVDCGAGCSCAVDLPVVDLHQLGLNPVFPPAKCLLLSALVALGNKKVARLGGRSLESEPEPEQQQQQHMKNIIACVCNATYVSFGCCRSQTGLIWETSARKLGELKV